MTAIHYSISAPDPHSHYFEVECHIPKPDANGQELKLPSWLRGSYLVRDFAKHVVDFTAESASKPLGYTRTNKFTIQLDATSAEVICRYRVYSFDESVRKAYLDQRRAFFNFSSLCYQVSGNTDGYLISLLAPPKENWRVATSLSPRNIDARGFGDYFSPDYEDLIDHPVEMSDFQRLDFTVNGVPHAYILPATAAVDGQRLCEDTRKICEVEHALFNNTDAATPTLDRYLFLTNVVNAGYGGLEHKFSSALICSRDHLPQAGDASLPKRYLQFLGLVSHEYFHLWNVKRITAKAFSDSDLSGEAYSRDLWHYEGVTSYFDDHFLLRAGIIKAEQYLDVIAEQATRIERTPGIQHQTLEDASFETWIKYYQPDENSPNANTNYYVKGAMVSILLDLTLRKNSDINLDHVMRELWSRYGSKNIGVPERGLEMMAQELSGLDLTKQFDSWLRSTDELPLVETLAEFGVSAQKRRPTNESDQGGRSSLPAQSCWYGFKLRPGSCSVAYVIENSPATKAGISAGDEIIAINGLKIGYSDFINMHNQPGDLRAQTIAFFRGDELQISKIQPEPAPLNTWTFTLADCSGDVAERRKEWIGA